MVSFIFACTNLAFLRHVSTSGGNDEETCGCVAVAEASQLRGCCGISPILLEVLQLHVIDESV